MADAKISSLPAASTASSADLVPIVQTGTTKRMSIGTLLASTDLAEQVQDVVGGMLRAGANVTTIYDDVAGTLTISSSGGGGGATDPEVVRNTIGAALRSGNNITVTANDVADTITIAVTGLATVATTGSYNDLTAKPTIPAAYTDEQVRDVIGAALVAGTNVTITPNDAGDTITISATGGGASGPITSSQITDWTEATQDAIGASVAAGTGIDVTYDDATGFTTVTNMGVPVSVGLLPAQDVVAIVQNANGTWPARPTSRTDIIVLWIRIVAGSANPASVTSPVTTGGYINDLVVGV